MSEKVLDKTMNIILPNYDLIIQPVPVSGKLTGLKMSRTPRPALSLSPTRFLRAPLPPGNRTEYEWRSLEEAAEEADRDLWWRRDRNLRKKIRKTSPKDEQTEKKMVSLIKKVVKEMFTSELEIIKLVEGVIERRVDELMKSKHNTS